jgi:hypothetical protein
MTPSQRLTRCNNGLAARTMARPESHPQTRDVCDVSDVSTVSRVQPVPLPISHPSAGPAATRHLMSRCDIRSAAPTGTQPRSQLLTSLATDVTDARRSQPLASPSARSAAGQPVPLPTSQPEAGPATRTAGPAAGQPGPLPGHALSTGDNRLCARRSTQPRSHPLTSGVRVVRSVT